MNSQKFLLEHGFAAKVPRKRKRKVASSKKKVGPKARAEPPDEAFVEPEIRRRYAKKREKVLNADNFAREQTHMARNRPQEKYADLSIDQMEKMAFLAGVGLTLQQICYCLKINYGTIANSAKYEEIMQALDEGRAKAKSKVNIALYRKACEGDVAAIKWWDTTRGDYKETVDHRISMEMTAVLPEQRLEKIKELSEKLKMLPMPLGNPKWAIKLGENVNIESDYDQEAADQAQGAEHLVQTPENVSEKV